MQETGVPGENHHPIPKALPRFSHASAGIQPREWRETDSENAIADPDINTGHGRRLDL